MEQRNPSRLFAKCGPGLTDNAIPAADHRAQLELDVQWRDDEQTMTAANHGRRWKKVKPARTGQLRQRPEDRRLRAADRVDPRAWNNPASPLAFEQIHLRHAPAVIDEPEAFA